MSKRQLSHREKIFWSAIGIGCGLTIFFYGVSSIPIGAADAVIADFIRGYFIIAVGVLMLVLGFRLAPYGKLHGSDSKDEGKNHINTTTGTTVNKEFNHYLYEERKSLLGALLDQSRSFDKYILTLAGGSFGLSFVFIQLIAPEPKYETMKLLIGAWSSFGSSILITLFSFLFSQKACMKQIEILNGLLNKTLDANKVHPNRYRSLTNLFNWLSMFIFIAGVGLLASFAVSNLEFSGGG